MTDLPLDAAALDGLSPPLTPQAWRTVIAQARAALSLRDELAQERRWAARMSNAELVRALTVNGLADEVDALKAELAECRAKLAQANEAIAYAEKVDAERARMDAAKIAQAEQERDEAQRVFRDSMTAWNDTQSSLAAAQAETWKLREALHEASTFIAVECDASSEAFQNAESLLATTPGSRDALSDMIFDAFLAGYGKTHDGARSDAIKYVKSLLTEEGGQS